MRLTSQTQYAIRMLMYSAQKEGLSTTKEIAGFYTLPEKFMLKVLHALGKTGFIKTVRGRGGGFCLQIAADQIRLGEVVQLIENDFELAECFGSKGTNCPLVSSCGLNEALSGALSAFFAALNTYTIEDLITKEHNIGVLLQLHEATKTPFTAALKSQ